MAFSEENPAKIKRADIVVGIPSYNEALTISYPTIQASLGLLEFFGDKRSVIINCDNNSTDGTKEAFLNTPTEVPKVYICTPPGVRGKGNNLMNLFTKVNELGAHACIIIDADVRSITPRWIRSLGEPLFMDFGFVTPLYVRHKYDATITNNIAYPFIRSIYGRRVRQPIGGEFGVSEEMIPIYLERKVWDEEVSQFGIDIWMTTLAIAHNIPICQSFMGRPKIHRPKDPGAELGPMFRQVMGTIFGMMDPYEPYWRGVRWSKPTAVFGFGLGEVELPPAVEIDRGVLYERLSNGIAQFQRVWERVLAPEVFGKLMEVAEMRREHLDFPTQLWTRILFDYAISYQSFQGERETLLNSLIPLYFGKVYSFVQRTERMSIQEVEEYIEDQCMVFEETRPYLDKRWGRQGEKNA
ncbi:MAG: glycosyltransferase [Deltaproteobacteria bacterium]|nr:MAG: glycosyltransferase [Deltaproteobacteria bacterium]